MPSVSTLKPKKYKTAGYTARTVTMPFSVLEDSEEYLHGLVEKARTVSRALRQAQIPHSVVGGLAVLAHISQKDKSAARNTNDMDLLLRREDLGRAKIALEKLGYQYRVVTGIPCFAQKGKKFRDGIHLVWAGEKIRPDYVAPAPDLITRPTILTDSGYECISITDLLIMKLTSFRLKDQVHIQDMLSIKLISAKVEASLPPELRARLEQVKETTRRER